MILLKQIVPKDFNLFLFGDDHEGSVLRHKEGWNKLVDMINSPYGDLKTSCNFAVDHGDIIEAICTDDPRYDSTTTSLNITKQIKQAIKNREKIKKKLVCILDGNHPRKLRNFGDITSDICQELGVRFGTWSAKITYETKTEFLFKHHCVHGSRTITSTADDPKRRLANMELILKRLLKDTWGDCLIHSMGHTHKLLICEPEQSLYLSDSRGSIQQNYTNRRTGAPKTEYIHPDHRWYVNTGAFYKLFENGLTSYAEVAGYAPISLGFAVARLRNGDIEGIDKVTI